MIQRSCEVLISGAGPVGLTLALVLQRAGVRVRIVDRDLGPTEQSRALWVHPRTLEYWASLGLAERALARGLKVPVVNLLVNGQQRGSLPLYSERESPFTSGIVLEQSETVRLLLHALEEAGGTVEWGKALQSFDSSDRTRVDVRLQHGDDLETCTAQFLVGADGAKSVVRHQLQLSFEGDSYAQRFFLADVDMDWTKGRSGVFLGLARKGFFAVFPMPASDRHFRLLGSIDAAEFEGLVGTAADGTRNGLDQAQIEAILSERSGERLNIRRTFWATAYQTHKRMASSYRVGNVFIAGDAAHVHSPAGGQGMNLGIGDAMNLGWKLARALRQGGAEALLGSYELERMPVAAAVISRADRLFDLEVAEDRFVQWLRGLLMPLVARALHVIAPAREALFRFLSQTWIAYRDSPVIDSEASSGRVRPGDRLPHVVWADEHGQMKQLHDAVDGVNHVAIVTGDGTGWQRARAELEKRCITAKWVSVPLRAKKALQRLNARRPTLFLVRPDGHIAAKLSLDRQGEFAAFIDRLYAPGVAGV